MLNSNRPPAVADCPRCGEFAMMDPPEINALSRTTRGSNEKRIWVCSDCGTDEGMMDAFMAGATSRDEWPIEERPFQYFLDETKVALEAYQVGISQQKRVVSDTQKGKAGR